MRCAVTEVLKAIMLTLGLGLMAAACGGSPERPPKGEKPVVTVSILPQKYFVGRIAGERFDIQVMIPPGHNPATYAPTPRQMQRLARSEIYFRIGHVPFERAWMDNIAAANPRLKIIDTSRGVQLIEADGHHHPHGNPEPGNRGDRVDPHIWLSPRAVKIQAQNIFGALAELEPQNRRLYQQNLLAFEQDIDNLIKSNETLLEELPGRKFMVFHPAWAYFARDYRLEQLPIEIEGKEPNPAGLKELIDQARREKIGVIFVQKQFDTHNAEAVAREIGGRVVQLDPLAEEWLANMKAMAAAFKEALK